MLNVNKKMNVISNYYINQGAWTIRKTYISKKVLKSI